MDIGDALDGLEEVECKAKDGIHEIKNAVLLEDFIAYLEENGIDTSNLNFVEVTDEEETE